MAFHTRTDEAGTVIWSKYGDQPADLAEGEVECTEAEYEAGRSEMWATKQKAETATTSRAKSKNVDKPA